MEKELNDLLQWNEKEGKELHACQFLCQKKMLQDVKKQLQDMHEKFNKLKEDFVYNLRILEERDKELGHYDVTVARLKTSENAKQAEISDLRVQLGKMEQMLVKERRKRCKLHYYCQQHVEEHKLELERFCSSRNSHIDHQHEEYVNLKHHMERKIQELEELACQKQELLAEFDAEMKKRECEFQKQTIEMGNLVLSHEVKVKLLTRELEALKETRMQTPESLETAEIFDLRLEKENQFNDFVTVKDAWHEELAHAAKEKDAMPASVKEAQVKQFKKLKQQIRELQMRHKNLEIELCRREWSHSACLREKDALIRKLQEEIVGLKPGQDSHLIEISKESASKEFQIQSMHGQEDKLRAQLAKFQKDAEWLKQLSLAAESKWILEQSKMQAELDWQQLCENAESNWYQKSEDLTQSLSSAREQVKADLQKTDYSLHEARTVLSALTVEGEETMQASFNHSILPEGEKQIFQCDDKSSLSKDIPTLEIKKLQEQNANLRAAIAQMRKEMESLDEQMLSPFPLTENRQLAEQGSSCTSKILTGTTLSNIKVSSTNLDCMVNPDTEEGPKAKVLEEKMVDLGQELPDVGPGVGLQYGVSCTLQGMQNKLKEAARKISILSQEKQQLIEMGNRLRAELVMVLKEGLWHPVSSKGCTVCIASGSLFPRELVKRTQCQLSALKHLQHRLTTQELQYTTQHHPSRMSSLIACPSLKEEEAPSSCGEETELPSAEVQLDFSIENHEPEQRKADTSSKIVQCQPLRQSPSQAQQVQLSSSGAHNFCQGIWQTLEMGSSPPVLSPQKNTDQVPGTEACHAQKIQLVQNAVVCVVASILWLLLLSALALHRKSKVKISVPRKIRIKWLEPSTLEFEVTRSPEQSEESRQHIKTKDKLEMPSEDLTVRGTRLEVQQKLKSRNLPCAHPIKPKISSKMAKIRNYNIKD